MRPSPVPRRWDNSPISSHPRRSLCVDPDSPSRLLRCAQRGRCRECGNPAEWSLVTAAPGADSPTRASARPRGA
ncbi:DUF6083 domain-containing protein [Streptomyces sp. 3214.6]|uniref:DUF6083 domain-containing protein n=1 Tax=Streptomyces sp. 3214.6 TaxID=1882757 RepID=UPI001E43FA52|nr:DUF6083 domain-containing protein [Streptomyces sp. 3214.6]